MVLVSCFWDVLWPWMPTGAHQSRQASGGSLLWHPGSSRGKPFLLSDGLLPGGQPGQFPYHLQSQPHPLQVNLHHRGGQACASSSLQTWGLFIVVFYPHAAVTTCGYLFIVVFHPHAVVTTCGYLRTARSEPSLTVASFLSPDGTPVSTSFMCIIFLYLNGMVLHWLHLTYE